MSRDVRRSSLKNARASDIDNGVCAQHRQKVSGRHLHPPGFRFLIDAHNSVVHDLAVEQLYCDLDRLYASNTAHVYRKTLLDAISEGFKPCEECIGERASDAFTGRNTVLLVIKLPARRMRAVEAVAQRELFNRSVTEDLSNNKGDQEELFQLVNRYNAGSFLYQAHREAKRERHPKYWGEPDAVFSLYGSSEPTLGRDDDFLGDIFVPRAILSDEATVHEYGVAFIKGVLELQTFKRALSKLARMHRYRDLAVYCHSCESIDDWVIHREDAICSSATGVLTPQPITTVSVTTQPLEPVIAEPVFAEPVFAEKCWKAKRYVCGWRTGYFQCWWEEYEI